jgi:hypothetical protein
MESTYLHDLTARLRALTGHPAVATALVLLLRPGFDDAVWNWLAGGEPAEVLRDRGITIALHTDAEALAAMGALLSVICSTGRRLLVVLDELDLMFVKGRRVTASLSTGIRRLLSAGVNAGAFIVLSGLPSFLDVLPNQIRDRLGSTITTSPFDAADVERLVAVQQRHVAGSGRAVPFDPEVIGHLADLTAGVPRSILGLCHRLVRISAGGGSAVTLATVHEAARSYIEERYGESFTDQIAQVLADNGWPYERDRYVGATADSHVDFWIDENDNDDACAILAVGNILEPEDLAAQRQRILTVQAAAPRSEILLVVMGFLSRASVAEITDITGTPPLNAHPGRFAIDLSVAVRRILSRLSDAGRDPVARVGNRIARMSAQQSSTHSYVAQIALAMDSLRKENAQTLDGIRARLQQMLATAAVPAVPAAGVPSLPPPVEAIFDDALRVLQEMLDRVDALLSEVLQAAPEAARDARMTLRARLRQDNATVSVGVVVLLQRLVTAFRDALRHWYETGNEPSGRRDPDTLNEICLTYSAACEYLPLFQLDELRHITARFAAGYDELTAEGTIGGLEIRAPELFGNLAARVQGELTGPTLIHRT